MDNGAQGGSSRYWLLQSRKGRGAVASALLPCLSKPTGPRAGGHRSWWSGCLQGGLGALYRDMK